MGTYNAYCYLFFSFLTPPELLCMMQFKIIHIYLVILFLYAAPQFSRSGVSVLSH